MKAQGDLELLWSEKDSKLFTVKLWGNFNIFKPFYSFNLAENVKLRKLNINWILEQTQPGPRGLNVFVQALYKPPLEAEHQTTTTAAFFPNNTSQSSAFLWSGVYYSIKEQYLDSYLNGIFYKSIHTEKSKHEVV